LKSYKEMFKNPEAMDHDFALETTGEIAGSP
jgi:hypothetical protein